MANKGEWLRMPGARRAQKRTAQIRERTVRGCGEASVRTECGRSPVPRARAHTPGPVCAASASRPQPAPRGRERETRRSNETGIPLKYRNIARPWAPSDRATVCMCSCVVHVHRLATSPSHKVWRVRRPPPRGESGRPRPEGESLGAGKLAQPRDLSTAGPTGIHNPAGARLESRSLGKYGTKPILYMHTLTLNGVRYTTAIYH